MAAQAAPPQSVEVRKRAKELFKPVHPDKCSLPGAAEAFNVVRAAERVLTDETEWRKHEAEMARRREMDREAREQASRDAARQQEIRHGSTAKEDGSKGKAEPEQAGERVRSMSIGSGKETREKIHYTLGDEGTTDHRQPGSHHAAHPPGGRLDRHAGRHEQTYESRVRAGRHPPGRGNSLTRL